MVTSIFPPSLFSPPLVFSSPPPLLSGMFSRFVLWLHVTLRVAMCRPRLICWSKFHTWWFYHLLPWFPILLHSSVCLLIWFSFRKFPWCTALRPPLCLQQHHLPQAFPSLQQPQPTRFANLQLCFLNITQNRCFEGAWGFVSFFCSGFSLFVCTSCWPTHSNKICSTA